MFVLCCLVACILLGGCGASGDKEGPTNTLPTALAAMQDYNAQNKYMQFNDINFQETDDFFCGATTLGNYAKYYDKASGISGPLCADPACAHDSPECGAYIGQSGSLACHNGKRYWVAPDSPGSQAFYLWRSDLVGTNQERVKPLDWNKIILTYQPQRYVIHRGRLYILGRANTVEGVEAGTRMTLLSMSLGRSEEVAVLYDKTFETGVETTARFVGDSIYLSTYSYSQGSPCSISITKFGLQDGSTEVVYEETGIVENLGSIWVTDQEEIYLPGASADWAYLWKLEDGKRREIVSWKGADFSTPKVADGIAFVNSVKDELRWIDIVDLSGNAIYSGKLFTEELPEVDGDPNKYSFAMVGGDTENIIVNIEAPISGTAKRFNYTILLDLRNNAKPTVLWSSEG